ncbi:MULTISPECIES: type I polyketide synthase, partial [Gammaproteobacteria]|uniref:type I polyketide synthase n=1 Tax=Gammaproteobacteria TaxID=1236 RepID=UPI00191230B6
AIDYVETHGTGTVLGDPIEVNALGAALCQGRTSDQRLTLGSVKANIGHLESAAGMAGIIKVVMALQHKEFPPQANYTQPNPRIRWDEFPLSVPTQRTPWPANGRPRTAGVSGFGFGGTNAHVILQEAPVRSAERIVDCSHPQHLLTLSAQSAASLAALRQRYVTHLRRHPELAPQDLCFSANTGRAALDYRAVFTGRTLEELHQQLQDDNIATANLPVADAPRVAFLFTGQGAQYLGMGKELYANQPTFRETIDRCSDYILAQEGWSLVDLLYAEGAEAARLDQTVYTQPALFCVEYALATMWMAWGVTPSAVMGHSIGEYVAACVAQVFSLEDALKLVIARGRLMQTLPAGGAMAAVRAGQSVVEAVIAGFGGAVSIAAFNSPSQTVISGDADAVAHCCEILTAQQVRTVHLSVSHAFHSARLEPILDAFEQVADEVTYQTPQIPLISNLSAEPITPGMLCGRYWRDHARQPVAFARGLETLASLNCELWLEVGPHPVLIDLAATQMPVGVSAMAMLNRRRDDWEQTLETLGALYRQGWVPDWKAFYAGCGGQQVELPAYAW